MSQVTEIICIVDRSGSMEAAREDAIGGFNAFLRGQQELPDPARLTLVLFDNVYELAVNNVELKQVPPLDRTTFVPRGTTALLDAVGRAIDDVKRRLEATPEALKPGKVIFAILTDGKENASSDYTRDKVFQLITEQRGRGWEFLFLAAVQDAIEEGATLGVARDRSVSFARSRRGMTTSFSKITTGVTSFRRTGKVSRDWDTDPEGPDKT
jgi:hypothetical protein